jgi:hypothetical protein
MRQIATSKVLAETPGAGLVKAKRKTKAIGLRALDLKTVKP